MAHSPPKQAGPWLAEATRDSRVTNRLEDEPAVVKRPIACGLIPKTWTIPRGIVVDTIDY